MVAQYLKQHTEGEMGIKTHHDGETFQSANVRITEQMVRLMPSDFPSDFLLELECECAQADCDDTVHITPTAYMAIIRGGGSFMVRPGHYQAKLETAKEKQAEYWVIVKRSQTLD